MRGQTVILNLTGNICGEARIVERASGLGTCVLAEVVLTRHSVAEHVGLPILAEVKAHAHSQEPAWYTTAPVPAIRKLLGEVGYRGKQMVRVFQALHPLHPLARRTTLKPKSM